MAYYRKNRGTTYTNTGTRGSTGSGSTGSVRTSSNYIYPDSYVNSGTGDGATPRGEDTPVVTTGNFSTINPLNPYGSSQGDIINQLLKLLGTDNGFAQLLQQLGIQTGNMNAGEIQDWNKQIMDALMQYAITQEQRGYNKSVLDEQRIYDSPMNQLARLMGAGISRDAALQLLSGSGASGSGGSALIGDPNALPASAIPGTQSDLNAIQKQTAIANTVFGAISAISGAIGSLGSFGISAATLGVNMAATRAATAGQLLSNQQLSKTLAGIEAASTVIGAVSSSIDAGFTSTDKQFDSAQDMVQYIRDNAQSYEPFKQLVSSGALDAVAKDFYSLSALNSGYKSWRESRDYNLDRKHLVNMYALDEMFKSIDIERLQSEIEQNRQSIQESIANVINSTRLADSQIALNQSQIVLNNSNAALADVNTDLARQQLELQQLDLDWINANIQDIDNVRTTQLMLDSSRWSALKDNPEALKAEISTWLQDKANQRTAIALEAYYYKSQMQAAQDRENAPAGTDQALARTAVYYHNLFTQYIPQSRATQQEADVLGGLAGSAVALKLLRKAPKLAALGL